MKKIEKYSLKTKEGNLIALGAYRVMGRKAYVYILYLESAPASNPTLTAKREYYGIGEVMIAFGIKFSIDSGCAAMFCLKPRHRNLPGTTKKDFHARPVATLNSGGPQRYMLADEDAWNLFEKISCRGGTVMEKMLDERYKIDELADAAVAILPCHRQMNLPTQNSCLMSAISLESITMPQIRKRARLLRK